MRLILAVGLLSVAGVCHAESGCFRTTAEAAAQTGVRDVAGFRLEGVRTDAFAHADWAMVKRCGHPERPAVVVRNSSGVRAVVEAPLAVVSAAPMVRAGDEVRVSRVDGNVRLDVSGTAVESARVGERVRVRVAGGTAMVSGRVQSDGSLEMEAR